MKNRRSHLLSRESGTKTNSAGDLACSLQNLQLRDSAGLAPASPHPFVYSVVKKIVCPAGAYVNGQKDEI
jgi:hypothetical protein